MLSLVAPAFLLLLGYVAGASRRIPAWSPVGDSVTGRLAISIGLGLLFFHFPMVSDYYGNARSFLPLVDEVVEQLPHDFVSDLFSLRFEAGQGRQGVMLLYTWLSYVFQVPYQQIFLVSNAVCGGLFIFVWLTAVERRVKNPAWRMALSIAGICSPFLLVFLGHIETYAPLYLLLLIAMLSISQWVRTKQVRWLVLLVLLQLVGIRFHMLMTLTLPATALLIAHQYASHLLPAKILHLKGLLQWIFLPTCLVGLWAYFFLLGDHKDPRTLDHVNDIERLFLPIISPPAPLDKYNLLSLNHIFDFGLNIIGWSPAILFIFGVCTLSNRWKKVKERLDFAMILLSFLLITAFLFMFNPLLSLPMDWDLFAFPFPLLLALVLMLAEEIGDEGTQANVLLKVVAFALLGLPTFFVHNAIPALSDRMEQVGLHVYRTYYLHSSTYLLYALQMVPNDLPLYKDRKRELIRQLRPEALPGKDKHYGLLLTDSGILAYRADNDFAAAHRYFLEALSYDPGELENVRWLVRTSSSMQDFDAAVKYADRLVEQAYPDTLTSLQVGLHAALLADQKTKALQYAAAYLQRQPAHNLIQQVREGLLQNEDRRALARLMEGLNQ